MKVCIVIIAHLLDGVRTGEEVGVLVTPEENLDFN